MGTSALEDAKLKLQDIVLTYVDFSSAFNTVPHGGLEHIMSLLGFPEDAVAIVRAIYYGAATSIVTPHGLTDWCVSSLCPGQVPILAARM
jgi:hypothetical protein